MNKNVVIIGGGPAGLAAAIIAAKSQSSILIIERCEKLGGMLRQCIHDGFGLEVFGESLTGPEYTEKYIEMIESNNNIEIWTSSFASKIEKNDNCFKVLSITPSGIKTITADKVIVATGCREKTAKQAFIQGDRPAGIFTAGQAQYYTNILGKLPTKKCVILGSGDIGLIMARRLSLEGARVLGVYEAKSEPSGLIKNIEQCLNDFDIPIYLSTTISRVIGKDRLEAVEIVKVDDKMEPIKGTEEIIECDGLILSVGLIPENEILGSLNVKMSARTHGPIVDQNSMTSIDGIYSVGCSLHVNNLIDYVSISSSDTGLNAIKNNKEKRELIEVIDEGNILYTVPEVIDINSSLSNITFYFRTSKTLKNATLMVLMNKMEIFKKTYNIIRSPDVQKVTIDFKYLGLNKDSKIKFSLIEG